jgi:NADH dehydrogenase
MGARLPAAEHRVVLLGGGYVTLHAYAGLMRRAGRAVRRGDIQVVVISTDDAHSFHGFTGEVLAGLLPYDRTRTPLVDAMPHAHVVLGRATSIDAERRIVCYQPVHEPVDVLVHEPVDEPSDLHRERVMGYDALVVGTGGREPATTVPGLAEHGFTLRAPGDIAVLTERIREAAAHRGPRRHTVLVAGGGLAGVEMAAAVADLGGARVRVELVHSGDAILPELRGDQPRLARRAEQELERLGVRVRLGVRLASVTEDHAHLSDGTSLPASTVIGTIGQRPVQLPGLDAHRDPRGRLVTRPDLSVVDGVWAAGDAACVVHPTSGEPVPANALWAIKGGEHVGRNLARVLRGRPTLPFAYRGLGQAASFGFGRSISELYGIPFTGWLAWVLRLTFFLRFMPSRRKAAQVVGDFARVARRVSTPASHPVSQRMSAPMKQHVNLRVNQPVNQAETETAVELAAS